MMVFEGRTKVHTKKFDPDFSQRLGFLRSSQVYQIIARTLVFGKKEI